MAVTPTCHQSRHFSANNVVAVSSVGDVRTGTRSALNAFSHAHERKRERERKGGETNCFWQVLIIRLHFQREKKRRRRLFTITLHYRVPLTRFPFSIYEPCFLIVDFFVFFLIPEYVFMLPRSYKNGTLHGTCLRTLSANYLSGFQTARQFSNLCQGACGRDFDAR